MKMISKISVIILMILVFIQLNAFPVPSYSYSTTRQGQLQIGLGLFSGVSVTENIINRNFYQPYIKYGLPYDFDMVFGFHLNKDVYEESSSNRIFMSIGYGYSLKNNILQKITARLSYGFSSENQEYITVALDGKIKAVNLSTGYSYYYTTYPSPYSAKCVFMRLEMKSPDRLINVNPYLLMQYEYAFDKWDYSHKAIVVGGGFSLYLNLLKRGEE
ncbi:MAG: autotransporter outer membrane beta-barrel domain-containing protein [bacterium]